MKLGIAGLLPGILEQLEPAVIRQVRTLGFTGTTWNTKASASELSLDRARQVRKMLSDEGVDMIEFGRYQTTLIDENESVVRSNIEQLRKAFVFAKALGSPAVVIGVGSFNPKGQWIAHKNNYIPRTRERLVKNLKEATKIAESEGVILALENHTNTPLRDAKITRAIIDEVNSSSLMSNLDPINWVTFENIFETGKAVQEMIATMKDTIYCLHNKGITLEDKMVCHIDEVVTGAENDFFDHTAYLKAANELPKDLYMIIEHLPKDAMPKAREHLIQIADREGIAFCETELKV
jgi:sugar phosphate isomerase/epimerase